MHIDEAGCKYAARHVDHFICGRGLPAFRDHRLDTIPLDQYVSLEGGCPCTIDDLTVTQK
jgi:hypothetical protein